MLILGIYFGPVQLLFLLAYMGPIDFISSTLPLFSSIFLIIFSIFLLKGKKWAWKTSIVFLTLLIIIIAQSVISAANYSAYEKDYTPTWGILGNIVICLSLALLIFLIVFLKKEKEWAWRSLIILIIAIALLMIKFIEFAHVEGSILWRISDRAMVYFPFALPLLFLLLDKRNYLDTKKILKND